MPEPAPGAKPTIGAKVGKAVADKVEKTAAGEQAKKNKENQDDNKRPSTAVGPKGAAGKGAPGL
jgi:hypothetical protein